MQDRYFTDSRGRGRPHTLQFVGRSVVLHRFAWQFLAAAVVASSGGCGGTKASGGADASAPADASVDVSFVEADGEGFFNPSDDGSDITCLTPGVMCPGGPIVCPDGGRTTLTGTVYDPAGTTPLSGAVVFIPNGAVKAIVPGTSACTCDDPIGDYVTVAVSDATGAFTMTDVPTGKNVPLVVQIGKWRRQVVVPTVVDCATTALPPELTRLPRNRTEGDLPQMALLTGSCDELACFLRGIGIDAQEFTGPDLGGSVHVYRGAGPGPDLMGGGGGTAGDCTGTAGPCPLWSTRQALERYDTVFLGCECGENNQTKPDMTPMHDWLEEGGSVVAVHNQETWFKNGPADFRNVAGWAATDAGASGPFVVDTSFAGGSTLDRWLGTVHALDATGSVPLNAGDVSTSLGPAGSHAAGWIFDRSSGATAATANVQYLSFFTPTPPLDGGPISGNQCGRAILTDVHVGAGGMQSSAPVPMGCSGALDAEARALEFLLFSDVPRCATQAPAPPGH